jgi:heat shock protein HslJ
MSTASVRAVLVGCLFGLVVSACGAGSEPSLIRSSAPGTLAGTAWTAVLVAGQPTVAASQPTATFTADRIEGTTGCNRYGGSYQYANGVIKFGQLMSTLIGCDGAIGAVEGRFNTAIAGATSVSMDPEGRLVLDGPGGSITFVVVPRQAGG